MTICAFVSEDISAHLNFGKLAIPANSVRQENAELFQELLSSSKTLTILDVSNCELNEKQSSCLADLLILCTCLRSLNLSGNISLGEGQIFKALQKSSETLSILDVSDCKLNEVQGSNLVDLFYKCSCLKTLNLYGNRFSRKLEIYDKLRFKP